MIRSDYLPFGKPNFSDDEIAAVTRVMRSGWVGMGAETIAFENELAQYLGVSQVVTVNSCTSALFLALAVLGVGPGDEVICPSLTWCATANAALYLGATPIFCDIDPNTLCVSIQTIKEKITPKTKAVMVVHLGGYPIDIAELRATLPETIAIVEDAAHALGSEYPNGKKVGASGNLVCFSFYANKNLSTGEGGAIALTDAKQADRLRSLRQNALPVDAWKRFTHPQALLMSNLLTELGYKMNYTDLQACIGRVQLRRQKEFHARRLEIARRYYEFLKELPSPITFQSKILDEAHARHLFLIELPVDHMALSRDEFLLELRARNVGATIHYTPLHIMPLYNPNREKPSLPHTEKAYRRILTLPISASMDLEDADYVILQIKELLKLSN